MFLNITNHPSDKWSDEQTEAALVLGQEVMDIPFPNVPPIATTEAVMAVAQTLVATLAHIGPNADGRFALVQGEASLTFELSRMLLALGWRVVVACSDRKVVERVREDGTTEKTSVFEFKQFRALRG